MKRDQAVAVATRREMHGRVNPLADGSTDWPP
jgi:hypothetical protein